MSTGTENVAVGTDALVFNTGGAGDFSGSFNNAVGAFALFNNDGNASSVAGGYSNNALGNSALFENIIGVANTALGDEALVNNDSDGAGLANGNTANEVVVFAEIRIHVNQQCFPDQAFISKL